MPSFTRTRWAQRVRGVAKCLLLFPLVLTVLYVGSTSMTFLGLVSRFLPMERCSLQNGKDLSLDHSFDAGLDLMARSDVQTCTYWRAPVIWEKMFDPHFYDQMHKNQGSSVALTVFAVGRYLDAYLHDFLNSSERFFMPGLPVTYYVFTDAVDKVPKLNLAADRSLEVIRVEKHSRWQDISMMRMKTISDVIQSDIRHRCTHVFCFDVDQVFNGRFGSEALGDSVAVLHAYYYRLPKVTFTYDRNPRSKAFLKTGDFYYHAAVFGGKCERVKALADACHQAMMEDKKNEVEALWHDESHLNKYLWLHKPSRVLSPEFCWDPLIGHSSDVLVERLLWRQKQYQELRTP